MPHVELAVSLKLSVCVQRWGESSNLNFLGDAELVDDSAWEEVARLVGVAPGLVVADRSVG